VKHKKTLHVYPAANPGDSIAIVGDHDALLTLRNAINASLANTGQAAKVAPYAADGKNYLISVRCITEGDWQQLPLPYAMLTHDDTRAWDRLNGLLTDR
jgi:hypothetical protein